MRDKLDMLRNVSAAFDEAMKDEQIPPRTRQRVLNRFLFGNPDGDEQATLGADFAAQMLRHAPSSAEPVRDIDGRPAFPTDRMVRRINYVGPPYVVRPGQHNDREHAAPDKEPDRG